jgi:flagellar M-ring protein FliF
VDATLNFDEIRRTDQNIVPLHGRGDEVGAVVRRRESIYRQPSGVAAVKTADTTGDRPAEAAGTLTSTNEVEYELSKSGEQVLSTPGGIRRISVGVIVPQTLTDDQLGHVRDIVSMAVGFSAERGDAISVEPLSRIMTKPNPAPDGAGRAVPVSPPAAAIAPERPPVKRDWWPHDMAAEAALLVAALVLIILVVAIGRRRVERNTLARRLSVRERQQLLIELKSWLEAEKAAAGGAVDR